MSKQDRIDELHKENIKLRGFVFDLKARHNKAVKALGQLAAGYGTKLTTTESWQTSMQNLAMNELVAVGTMPLREVL